MSDSWDDLVAEGRQLAQRKGRRDHWALGDLALRAEKVVPPDAHDWLVLFAYEIGVPPGSMKQYHETSACWPASTRRADETWSFHRGWGTPARMEAVSAMSASDASPSAPEIDSEWNAFRATRSLDRPWVDDRGLSLVDAAVLDAHHSGWAALKVLEGLDLERVGKLLTDAERAEYTASADAMGRWLDRYREAVVPLAKRS